MLTKVAPSSIGVKVQATVLGGSFQSTTIFSSLTISRTLTGVETPYIRHSQLTSLLASSRPLPWVNQNFEVISGSTKASKTSAGGRRISISATAAGALFSSIFSSFGRAPIVGAHQASGVRTIWMMLAGLHDPAALEAFRQRLDLVAAGNARLSELFRRSLEIVGEELEPDLGLGEHRRLVDPQPVRPELEADLRSLLVIRFEANHVAVEAHRLVELVRRHFHGDVEAALDGCGHAGSPRQMLCSRAGSPRISLR